jgi:hypothetical protein
VTPAGLTNFNPAAATLDMAADTLIGRDATDSKLKRFAPTGLIAQIVQDADGAYASGTTVIPFDNTIPQQTEGDEYLSVTITPKNAASTLLITVVMFANANPAIVWTTALFKDAGADALAAGYTYVFGNAPQAMSFMHKVAAGTTSPQTFKVRAGSNAGTALQVNGYVGAAVLGGAAMSSITVVEVLP